MKLGSDMKHRVRKTCAQEIVLGTLAVHLDTDRANLLNHISPTLSRDRQRLSSDHRSQG